MKQNFSLFVNLIDKNNEVIVKTSLGPRKIDLNSILISSRDRTSELTVENKVDKTIVKECLAKLCHKSNQIVATQRRLDILNFALKQLNQLQSIRIQRQHSPDNSLDSHFYEIKKFIRKSSINSNSSIEIEFTNKAIQIDQDCFYLFTCVQFEKLANSKSFFWINKCESFKTNLKPNQKHLTHIEFPNVVLNRLCYPTSVSVYLIYDVNAFFGKQSNFEFDKEKINLTSEHLNEFSVCLYQSKFNFEDYFTLSGIEQTSISQDFGHNTDVLFYLLWNYYKRFKTNFNQLENIWTSLSVKGVRIEKLLNLNSKMHSILK